ncbi:MAG: LuxR C-terminal-related transcriptional regulator [Pseudomonadota bacterium]
MPHQAIGALAFMGDLSMGQPVDHSPRTAALAAALARETGCDDDEVADCLHLALLRWSGCTANAAEFSGLLGDDVAGRRALIEGHDPFVAARPPPAPALAIAPLGAMHCDTVGLISGRLGLPARLASAASDFFETWDGTGLPLGKAGARIDRRARIVALAGHVEIATRLRGAQTGRAGIAGDPRFDPALVAALRDLRLNAILADPDPWRTCQGLLPTPEADLGAEAAARLLGDVAELKLPARIGETARLADLASRAAASAGLADAARTGLTQAIRLHRLGWVGLPNRLAESARANAVEAERIALAPHWTLRILQRMPALADAACLLAATATPALVAADRADRGAVHILVACLDQDAPGLDRAMRAHVQAARTGAARPEPAATPLTQRETDVLGELVRGATNKEIARRLGISPSTAGTHVESIYRKLDVSNRATAALRAMEIGLPLAPGRTDAIP